MRSVYQGVAALSVPLAVRGVVSGAGTGAALSPSLGDVLRTAQGDTAQRRRVRQLAPHPCAPHE